MFMRDKLVYYRMDMLSVQFWIFGFGGGGDEILVYWLSMNSIDFNQKISAFDDFLFYAYIDIPNRMVVIIN